MPTEEELSRGFAIGEWEVLPARGELRAGNRIETPEPKVFKVLLALAARGGDVVTKDDLVDAAWDGRATSDDAIVRAVHQLRGHLGDKERPYRYVDTLHRRGYRLKQNVVLHEDASSGDETGARKIRRRPWLAVGVAVAAIAIAATWLGGRDGLEAPVGSIGVLPFENLSGDPTQQYLVSGFKHELVKTLSNIPDFLVKDVQDPYVGLEVSDIAMRLGVESVLFGGLQREGDLLKVNYHVARGSDGITMSSGSITVSMDNIFGGQERLAETVRNDLLGESQQRLLSSSRPESTAGLDRYMRGLHAFRQRGQPGKLEQAMRLFEETITIDPSFGPAYLELAMAYALLPDARNAPLDEAHETAMAVVEQGIAADPSIRDAADAVVGFVHHKRKNWTRAEEAYLRAIGAPIVDSNAYNWYSLMLSGVGRLDAALEQALEAQRIDPSHGVINSRVARSLIPGSTRATARKSSTSGRNNSAVSARHTCCPRRYCCIARDAMTKRCRVRSRPCRWRLRVATGSKRRFPGCTIGPGAQRHLRRSTGRPRTKRSAHRLRSRCGPCSTTSTAHCASHGASHAATPGWSWTCCFCRNCCRSGSDPNSSS